ncbi:MAG: SDR family oxidoreductase [Actinomycetota bacterium]
MTGRGRLDFPAGCCGRNCVAPGPTDKSHWAGDDVRAAVAPRMVTGRLTQPGLIAAAVLMLASDHLSGNTTGATFTVDGGLVPML